MTDEELVADALRRNEIAVGSRLQALAIYGFMGLTVGIAMMLSGTAVTIEQHWGTAPRFGLGAPAAVGGAVLIVASLTGARTTRGWITAIIGTSLLSLFLVAFTISYISGAVERGVVLLEPDEPIPPDTSLPYVPFLYLNLSLLALLHLWTLIRLRRPRR